VGAFVRKTGEKVRGIGNYIKAALDKVLTYQTPPAVVKYMEMQSALGNPPWKKRGESN
jgi:hypothetical protein